MVSEHGAGRILRVKEGYNPNSSSLGSIVFALPAALVAAPAILAGVAAAIALRSDRNQESTPSQPEEDDP